MENIDKNFTKTSINNLFKKSGVKYSTDETYSIINNLILDELTGLLNISISLSELKDSKTFDDKDVINAIKLKNEYITRC